MNVREYNRVAWNRNVEQGNRWTIPVGPEVIAAARRGEWEIVLTPTKPVPRSWFPDLGGLDVLCLASGGGQQAPILAAAGACVTVLDNSPAQLGQDRFVAERDGLEITTIEGDMANLSMFRDGQFGLIVHPASNCFVPDVRPVWREAFRVLRPGCTLLAGVVNPVYFLFDSDSLEVRHPIPFSDLTGRSDEERRTHLASQEPLMFGHTLADLLGGQLDAGLLLTGFYEDDDPKHPLSRFLPWCLATRATKPIAGGWC